ncbi:hypothetical protein [Paenibacillus cremeus]|uniref:Uncharacterized protein n=1 Tax=Paenibacillus cremeus TaxID=2163881 RepID=A0A559KCL6_9BACL|nr:hypothetical protein [Paenibacillus cremeus]TVY09874.1 hypothetical protein FPZ49_10910 [Paenibacillus cremeus]
MDHIASLAADKVNYTLGKVKNNDMWYEEEIKRLKSQTNRVNELMVGKELFIDRLKRIIEDQQNEIDELKNR